MEELAEILFPYFYYKETGLITSIWVGSGHDQLHASIPFLDYIKSLLHTHFDGNRQFKHQFIILACKMASRFDKQTVRPNPIQKQTINFKRIRITLILGETIPFKRILT